MTKTSLEDIIKIEAEEVALAVKELGGLINRARTYIQNVISEEDLRRAENALDEANHFASNSSRLEKYFRNGITELDAVTEEYWREYFPYALKSIEEEVDKRPLTLKDTSDLFTSYYNLLRRAKRNGVDLDYDELNRRFYPKFGWRYLLEAERKSREVLRSKDIEEVHAYLENARDLFSEVGLHDKKFLEKRESILYSLLLKKAELLIQEVIPVNPIRIGNIFEAELILDYLKKINPDDEKVKGAYEQLGSLTEQVREEYFSKRIQI